MWASLNKLMALPNNTTIYCSHEYTVDNAAFALSVDPDNQRLIDRAQHVTDLRFAGEPTVPTIMSSGKGNEPLSAGGRSKHTVNFDMPDDSDAEVFAEIRRRKDNF